MYALGRVSAILALSMACLCACKAGTQAKALLTTINAPQGGKIVYGPVIGATTQAAAMAKMLSTVHNNCGEKPQIGRVFQYTGSNSVGVFFTVTDHPDGNLPLAGMVIATANAIMGSYKADMQRAQAIANAQSAPIIAQMQQTYQAHQQALTSFTQQQIANIHQIGANATARYNATQAANSAEQSSWEASQDANARNSAGFSNYLLDQTVVQNNFTSAHSTQWNSAADAMVKANPNKYSYVNTPNYIPETDY
jgi:hypothetical protein